MDVNTQCRAWKLVECELSKKVFVKSLVVIRVISSILSATNKVTKHPTWGAIQISVLS